MSSRSRFRGTSVLSCRRTATGKAVTFYTGNSKIIVSVGGEEVSPIRGRKPAPYGTWERVGQFSSVPQSCPTLWDPHGLHHTRLPCPSPAPRVFSNSCPSSRWCLPTISSSVVPFSFCLQSFPTSGSFQISQFFASGVQSVGASTSASVLPMNWFPLGLTGLISLQSKDSQESSPTP